MTSDARSCESSSAMTRARAVFGLTAGIGLSAVALIAAAAVAALTRVSYDVPSLAAFAAACERWMFLDHKLTSVLVLAAGSVALAVLARGAASARRQRLDGRRFQRDLPLIGSLPGHPGVSVVDDPAPQAFCAGLLHPRVYVSSGALQLLSPDQLRAVLTHEAHHARQRDPLRLLVIRALADGLFFVPAVRRLGDRYAELAELAADEEAERGAGDPRALASALLAFDAHPHPAAVGIAPERVDRLLGRSSGWQLPTLVLLAAGVTLVAFGALTMRLLQAADQASVTLPALAAEACMIAMAAGPMAIGASAILGGRRLLRS